MEYNLVRNAQLSYSINNNVTYRILSTEETSYINDNDISFDNSIQVSGIEQLTFESTFNRRIKIDNVKLYLYTTTASGIALDHINFYYTNSIDLDYELITDKFVGDNNFYYSELPFPSAPIKVKVTVSGLDCSISEYFISNDDYPIGFGKDGDLSKLYITRTDDNNRTETQSLAIYNRNTNSLNDLVSAYVCIDYTGEIGDEYLKISDNIDSGFIGIDDNIMIEDNLLNSTYTWDMGKFNDTKIVSNNLVLDITETIYMQGGIPHPDTTSPILPYGNTSMMKDEINKILYMVIPDYYLKLYKYSYINDDWTFIGKINPGCSGFEKDYSVAKMGDYIYVLINKDGDFGRYDLNGIENNWEVLETPPLHTPIEEPDEFCICSDNKEYIYFLSYLRNSSPTPAINTDANFAQYSTISGSTSGWEPLSNMYEHEYGVYSTYIRCILRYDADNNCLYYIGGRPYNLQYIRKYDISTDVWDNSWFEINHYINSSYNFSFTYNDNFIYIISGKNLYSYDVTYYSFTNLVQWIDTVNFYGYINADISVVDSLVWSGEKQIIFISDGAQYYDSDNIYWYNGISSFGEYTTPIFDIVDSYKSSYFLIDYELQSSTSVTNAKFEETNLMAIRSSDLPMLPIERVYYSNSNEFISVNLYTDSLTEPVPNPNAYISINSIFCHTINNIGEICISSIYGSNYYIEIYNYDGTKKVSISDTSEDTNRYKLTQVVFDSDGGIFGYWDEQQLFWHFNSSLSVIGLITGDTEGIFTNVGQVFVKDFCAGDDSSVWYIHEGYNELRHCDMYFNVLNRTVLDVPVSIEPDIEGGVWVLHKNQLEIVRYNKNYALEITFSFNDQVQKMSPDKDGGLWVVQGTILKYFSMNGTVVENFILSNSVTNIIGGYKSCFLYANSIKTGSFFRYPEGLIKEVTFDESQFLPPLFLTHTHEDEIVNKNNYLPVSYDPNWGTDGVIEWEDIQLEGYYLSKNKYHQLKLTLRTSKVNNTPTVKKIKMVPSIKLVDIQKDTYKSIYLKLDVPNQFKNKTYNTKIKCWWEDKE